MRSVKLSASLLPKEPVHQHLSLFSCRFIKIGVSTLAPRYFYSLTKNKESERTKELRFVGIAAPAGPHDRQAKSPYFCACVEISRRLKTVGVCKLSTRTGPFLLLLLILSF